MSIQLYVTKLTLDQFITRNHFSKPYFISGRRAERKRLKMLESGEYPVLVQLDDTNHKWSLTVYSNGDYVYKRLDSNTHDSTHFTVNGVQNIRALRYDFCSGKGSLMEVTDNDVTKPNIPHYAIIGWDQLKAMPWYVVVIRDALERLENKSDSSYDDHFDGVSGEDDDPVTFSYYNSSVEQKVVYQTKVPKMQVMRRSFTDDDEVQDLIKKLLPNLKSDTQRSDFEKYYCEGKDLEVIASERGVDKSVVSRSIKSAERKIVKYLR